MAEKYDRRVQSRLNRDLETFRVVALVGARQVGKSSLAREYVSKERPYVSLDELSEYTLAQKDPQGFIASLPRYAIIDEIQRLPELLLPIKMSVDVDGAKGRYLLTGSANLLTLPRLADSLAGRMAIREIFPLAQVEIEGAPGNIIDFLFSHASIKAPPVQTLRQLPPVEIRDLIHRVVRGGYPEAVHEEDELAREAWFASYLLSMVQRDMSDIARITDVAGMAQLLYLLAMRSGRILNFTSLASESETPKTTIIRYLTLLEQTYLVQRIPAWAGEPSRRLTRAPKIIFADSGIAAHQSRLNAQRIFDERVHLGPLLETFVANEFHKHASWSDRRAELYHYRSSDGLEVDFILEDRSGTRIAIEVKATQTLRSGDITSIKTLVNDPKMRIAYGVVLHAGENARAMGDNIIAIPLSLLWHPPIE